MRFGPWEIVVIVLLIVILFGHSKIPGMMKNLANGINVFKKEIKNSDDDKKTATTKKAVAKVEPKKTKRSVKKTTKKTK